MCKSHDNFIEVQVDVTIPKSLLTESSLKNNRPSSGGLSDTQSSESSDHSEEDFDNSPKADNRSGQSVNDELNIKVCKDDQGNKHTDIGIFTGRNAIKITVRDPNIRFLQLFTKYNINDKQEYNTSFTDGFNKSENLAFYTPANVITQRKNKKKDNQQLNATTLWEDNPIEKLFKWAVDCKTLLGTEDYGRFYESPYYDQLESQFGSGCCEKTQTSKTMYDEPELWDIKVIDRLCKDKVRFITFIMNEKNEVFGVVEWSRMGRPYIATLVQESVIASAGEKLLKWSSLEKRHFTFFKNTTPHTYICEYKYRIESYRANPKKLPLWVEKLIDQDSKGRSFKLDIKNFNDKCEKQVVPSVNSFS